MMHNPVYTQSSSEESTPHLLIPLFETHWQILQLCCQAGFTPAEGQFPSAVFHQLTGGVPQIWINTNHECVVTDSSRLCQLNQF